MASAHKFDFLGTGKSTLLNFGLLRIGVVVAQPIGTAPKVGAVAGNQWRELQFVRVGGHLE